MTGTLHRGAHRRNTASGRRGRSEGQASRRTGMHHRRAASGESRAAAGLPETAPIAALPQGPEAPPGGQDGMTCLRQPGRLPAARKAVDGLNHGPAGPVVPDTALPPEPGAAPPGGPA